MSGIQVCGIKGETVYLTPHDCLLEKGKNNSQSLGVFNPLFGGRKVILHQSGNVTIISNQELRSLAGKRYEFTMTINCLARLFLAILKAPHSLYLLAMQKNRRVAVLEKHNTRLKLGFGIGDKGRVIVSVANMHEKPDKGTSYVSQAIHGMAVEVLDVYDQNWLQVKTLHDDYEGFVERSKVTKIGDDWKANKNVVRVKNLCGMVYGIKDIKEPPILELPYGAEVKLVEPFGSTNERWREIVFPNGNKGFIQQGDLEVWRKKTAREVTYLARTFLNRPYIWGGSSAKGFDCSGFVQMLMRERGLSKVPRDSRPQAVSELFKSVNSRLHIREGDLLFFGRNKRVSHVGLATARDRFIHSGVTNNNPKVHEVRTSTFPVPLISIRRQKGA